MEYYQSHPLPDVPAAGLSYNNAPIPTKSTSVATSIQPEPSSRISFTKTESTLPSGPTTLNASTAVKSHTKSSTPATTPPALAATPTSTTPPTTDAPIESPRLTAAEKGKGRAASSTHLADDPLRNTDGIHGYVDFDTSGRGKRTKKKRRLSAGEEIDPEMLDDHGQLKKPKKRAPRPSINPPTLLDPFSPDAPYSSADQAYFNRIASNNARTPLKDMKHACPVWATSRRALEVSADYFQGSRKTFGASVSVGLGGVARGVLLEGETAHGAAFWGYDEQCGTIMVPIGKPRARRVRERATSGVKSKRDHSPDVKVETPAGPSAPHINLLPDVRMIDPKTGSSRVAGAPAVDKVEDDDLIADEEELVEALLLSQRARIPIALAVTQDYSGAPFKVPRGAVVLGWFWLVQAWLEPVQYLNPWLPPTDPPRVQWHFRFEYCKRNTTSPWWAPAGAPERVPILVDRTSTSWQVCGPGLGGTTTVVPARHAIAKIPREQLRTWKELGGDLSLSLTVTCKLCGSQSEQVYKWGKWCLNEQCPMFFESVDDDPSSRRSVNPRDPQVLFPRYYMFPSDLGLRIRGYEPYPTYSGTRETLGSTFWQGHICVKCGMANDRRYWMVCQCEGCKHEVSHHSERAIIYASSLRNPIRPESTGPRQDNGFPSFAPKLSVTSAWSVYEEIIKVVKHVIGDEDVEIQHALHVREANAMDVLGRIFRDMQAHGDQEIPFKRHVLSSVSRRPFEHYLCPFFTYLCGPDIPYKIDSLPAPARSVPWDQAPAACLDVMDVINARAGCMYAGLPEFNSLLVALTPPVSIGAYQPRLTVQTPGYLAIMMMGSECVVRLRMTRGARASEIRLQHGDVVVVHTIRKEIEVQFKPEGFGMLCIARQIYRERPPPGRGAIVNPRDVKKPATTQEAIPGDNDDDNSNAPPPVPTVSRSAPLIDWYIGPRPLDESQPVIHGRPKFRRPPEDDLDEDDVNLPRPTVGDSAVALGIEMGMGMEMKREDTPPPVLLQPVIPPSPTLVGDKPAGKGKKVKGGVEGEEKEDRDKNKDKKGAGNGHGNGNGNATGPGHSKANGTSTSKKTKPRTKRISAVVDSSGTPRGSSPAGSVASAVVSGLGLDLGAPGSASSSPAEGKGRKGKTKQAKKPRASAAGAGAAGSVSVSASVAGTEGDEKPKAKKPRKSKSRAAVDGVGEEAVVAGKEVGDGNVNGNGTTRGNGGEAEERDGGWGGEDVEMV